MNKYLQILGKLLVVSIFFLAIWLLYQKLHTYSIAEIRLAIRQIPPFNLFLSLVFMVLNYIVLMGYDWLALCAIKKKIAFARVSLVSFVGSVVSLNFGALLGGSTVRYRLYTAWGFTPIDIVRLVLMLAVTFWVGAMGLAGLLFIFVPLELPPELSGTVSSVRPLGYALFGLCIVYHLICWKADGRALRIYGKEFTLPPLRIAIWQTLISGIDLMIAAACLFVLLPFESQLHFYDFLPSYLLAQVAVVLTHVPGGVGVLELVIMNLTQDIPANTLFAAILLFRVIYYILPLIFAAFLLGINELILRRKKSPSEKHLENTQDQNRFSFEDWLMTTTKFIVFATGLFFCLSAIIPVKPSDLVLEYYPPFIFISYALRSIIGVVLIVFAYGLDQKYIVHWYIVVTSLIISLFALYGSSGRWLELLLVMASLFPLMVTKYKFTRERVPVASHYPLKWLISCIVVIGAIMLITYLTTPLTNARHWDRIFKHFESFTFNPEFFSVCVQLITAFAILSILLITDKIRKSRFIKNK